MNIEWRPVEKLTVEALQATHVWEWRESGAVEEVRPTSLDRIPESDGNTVHLAFTKFILANGITMFGFCSPGDDSSLDYIQPVIIWDDIHWDLWKGDPPKKILEKNIFPMKYECLVPCEGKYLKETIKHSPNNRLNFDGTTPTD